MVAKGRGGNLEPKPILSLNKAWKAACVAAGCPGRIPHDLRRSAVRNLVRAGVSQTVAMKLTGHKTDSVFRRYDIVSPEDLRDAARKLDAAPTAKEKSASTEGLSEHRRKKRANGVEMRATRRDTPLQPFTTAAA